MSLKFSFSYVISSWFYVRNKNKSIHLILSRLSHMILKNTLRVSINLIVSTKNIFVKYVAVFISKTQCLFPILEDSTVL